MAFDYAPLEATTPKDLAKSARNGATTRSKGKQRSRRKKILKVREPEKFVASARHSWQQKLASLDAEIRRVRDRNGSVVTGDAAARLIALLQADRQVKRSVFA